MTDPRKSKILVVVVTTLWWLANPAWCFGEDLQLYTQEISKRSFQVMEGMMDPEGPLMRFGYPIFIILVFCSSFNQLLSVLSPIMSYFGGLMSFGGPLSMLAGYPSQEVALAREGESERDQRLLEVRLLHLKNVNHFCMPRLTGVLNFFVLFYLQYLDDKVKTSLANAQTRYQNELKKK